LSILPPPPTSPLFPYTTLFRSTRLLQIKRLIGKTPSIAAMSYRHLGGFPYVYPDNDLTYTENFMNMLWRMVEPKYVMKFSVYVRSEEHTSELQSRFDLVCRLLL